MLKRSTVTIVAAIAVTFVAAIANFAIISLGNNSKVRAEALIEQPADANNKPLAVSYKSPDRDSFLAEGGRAAVVMERPTDIVKVARGESVSTPIIIKHIAGSNPSSYVDVKISAPNGYILYPASLAATTAEEERQQASLTGKLIPGSIDLGTLVATNDANAHVKVNPGASSTAHVTLTVPKTFPDEMVGETIDLPIIITATDDAGNADTVYIENNSVVLEVIK
ncbi:exported protein of unknown function [Nitrososphaera viennensis EN76]|uniref:Uncharacterized protein n=1 Tax=Nitrososphaera viennensis EN76 TaxID=926571 RepID=A0A060HG20_9ARCH|nr:exported protein of unknown function [Nitrososphaera viennensis EN76]